MIKTTNILLLCFFLTAGLNAQEGTHIEVDYTLRLQEGDVIRITHEAGDNPHLSYFVEASPQDMASLQWRFSSIAPWTSISIDEHVSHDEVHFSKLRFSEQGQIDTLYLRSVGELRSSVFYHRYYPGSSTVLEGEEIDLREGDCDCPQPDIQERDEWCSNCPTTQTPVVNEPTHLIVHHSAGPNSSSDWAAVVRSIWDFHVNGRGWADIGYHYLIDPDGKIYQGRADDIQGAHFCAQNRNAMGSCVLGTFTEVSPTVKARTSWVDLASYAACKWGISPQNPSLHGSSGLDLLGVSGHRDGCATECPGQVLYGQLNDWRTDLRSRMDACSSEVDDSLKLTAESSLFPFAVNLNWSEGNKNIAQYRLQIRELNSGFFGDWQLLFPDDQNNHLVGLQAGKDYEFQIEGWNDSVLQQKSNAIRWSTDAWNEGKSSRKLVPNPITGSEVELVWTNEYRGEFDLAWINMTGQIFPLGTERKQRDTYFKSIPRIRLPAGKYILRISFEGKHLYVPAIML
ncbi:MAG: hypothetical protein GVX96_01825 [Bacteroidetes bacterium]|nr:hypothetical protein [Bacteroidota bacterium]